MISFLQNLTLSVFALVLSFIVSVFYFITLHDFSFVWDEYCKYLKKIWER